MEPVTGAQRPARRRRWRTISIEAVAVVAVIATPIVLFGCLMAWFHYELDRSEVRIMVDNQSSAVVDAMLFASDEPTPSVSVLSVESGGKADRSQNTWRTFGSATFRVRVGGRAYEGDAGTLIDDDGPHRFWVTALDDRVEVTRQSNERPWNLKMRAAEADTPPAR